MDLQLPFPCGDGRGSHPLAILKVREHPLVFLEAGRKGGFVAESSSPSKCLTNLFRSVRVHFWRGE